MIKAPDFLKNQHEIIPQTEINEFMKLHLSLSTDMEAHLEKFFDLGARLVNWREKILAEGENWGNWMEHHLPIKPRTAYNYIDTFENQEAIRKELKDNNVLELPSQRTLLKITRNMRKKKKRRMALTEYCPACGRGLTKKAIAWMNEHSAKH